MKGYRLQVTGYRTGEKAAPFRADARSASLSTIDYQLSTGHRGFTLIEMLVAVSIFTIVMTVAIGTLIVMLSAGSIAQSAQSLTMNLSFAVDSMARNIRTGYDYYCSTSKVNNGVAHPSSVRDCTASSGGGTVFIFTEGRTGNRTGYWYDSATDALYEKIDIPSEGPGSWVRLTSEDIKIDPFVFVVEGAVAGNTVQPMVRMTLTALPTDARTQIYPYYLQTTVTSKYLNI